MRHLHAWFVDPKMRMNPHLNHAQAIIGVNSGRAIGVIDTLQIVEIARAAALFARKDAPGYVTIRAGVEGWFAAYLDWPTTSRFGTTERDEKNNHGTCWLLQAASFGALLGRTDILADALFNLDVLAASAWLLGGGELIAWMAPFIADKSQWPLPPDVEYWDGFPVRQPLLWL